MEENKFNSIFDESKRKNKEEKLVETVSSSDETKKMIQDMYQKHDLIQKELETAFDVFGFSPQQMKVWLDNPDQMTADERALLESKRSQLEELVGSNLKLVEKKKTPKKIAESSEEDKKRKGKTLGSRRGWMPM